MVLFSFSVPRGVVGTSSFRISVIRHLSMIHPVVAISIIVIIVVTMIIMLIVIVIMIVYHHRFISSMMVPMTTSISGIIVIINAITVSVECSMETTYV